MDLDEEKLALAVRTLGEMPVVGRHGIGDITLIRLKHVLAEYVSDGAATVDGMLDAMARIVLESYAGNPPRMPTTEEALGITATDPPGSVTQPGPRR
jgi:hypothetical protein